MAFSALEEISFHTTTDHTLVLAVTAGSRPPPALTLTTRYVNSLTDSTSSHHFSFYFTASPIFPHISCKQDFLKTLRSFFSTPAHLLWIHLPHCPLKTVLAFTLKLQASCESTLFLHMPYSAMPPRSMTLAFLKRMEVASSWPDYLPTLSAAKASKPSLIVKHHILAIDEVS